MSVTDDIKVTCRECGCETDGMSLCPDCFEERYGRRLNGKGSPGF